MSNNYPNDSKLEMNQQHTVPLMDPQPPSYDQATGTYPTQQTMYPTVPDAYPPAQGPYPSAQGPYPTAQGPYPPEQGPYPPAQGPNPTVKGPYPTAPVAYQTAAPAMPQAPIALMEREPVQTVCGGCHNQVVTSVSSGLNSSAIAWIVYSFCCCWCYGFFLLCMDHFKTWKHSCPNCRMILKEFTPKVSGGTKALIAIAIVVNIILVILLGLGGGR